MWQTQLSTGTASAHVAAGDEVFSAGQNAQIALLVSGVIRVFLPTPRGRQLTLRYARSNDLIGVAPAFAGSAEWNAVAITDAALVLLTADDIRNAVSRDPTLAWDIVEHLAISTDAMLQMLADLAGQPTSIRIARHLWEMSLREPSGRIAAHISHQHLADAVGTAREVVTRELNVLRTHGVVDTAGAATIVIDEPRLAYLAGVRSSRSSRFDADVIAQPA